MASNYDSDTYNEGPETRPKDLDVGPRWPKGNRQPIGMSLARDKDSQLYLNPIPTLVVS